jgi:hypothetical protein
MKALGAILGLSTEYGSCNKLLSKGRPNGTFNSWRTKATEFPRRRSCGFPFSNDTRLADTAGHVSFFRFNSAAQAHERSYRALG